MDRSFLDKINYSTLIKMLITKVKNGTSCRGLEGKEFAELLMKSLFKEENLDFSKWEITEIPWVNVRDNVPGACVIIIYNKSEKQELSICVDFSGNILEIFRNENEQTTYFTLKNAIQ